MMTFHGIKRGNAPRRLGLPIRCCSRSNFACCRSQADRTAVRSDSIDLPVLLPSGQEIPVVSRLLAGRPPLQRPGVSPAPRDLLTGQAHACQRVDVVALELDLVLMGRRILHLHADSWRTASDDHILLCETDKIGSCGCADGASPARTLITLRTLWS